MRARALAIALAATACGAETASETLSPPPPSFDYPLDDTLRFHHLQALSTHNSYHVAKPDNDLMAWAYSHAPLDVQLASQGVRHVELDVRYDASLERFAVYHLPVIDEETTCRVFTDCLALIAAWSRHHPAHHPIVVQLELKDGVAAEAEDYFARLHAEIQAEVSETQLVTPTDVAPPGALGATIAAEGWPTLGKLRGKIVFTLDDAGAIRDAYTHQGTNVDDRILFPSSSPGDPYAAITVINDPISGSAAIAAALAANMLVRTRADADVTEAAANDPTRREAALTSGAHFITTDFPAAVEGMEYFVTIEGGTPSRCNPITGPTECTAQAIEDPAQLNP